MSASRANVTLRPTNEFLRLLPEMEGVGAGGMGGRSALHYSCAAGNLAEVKRLIQEGKKVNSSSKLFKDNGREPLHLAVKGDHVEVVKELLKSGANPNAFDDQGMRPLHLTAQCGSLIMLRLLIREGANVEASNLQGERAIHLAAASGKLDILKNLWAYQCDLHALDSQGRTALHHAAQRGHLDAVIWLEQCGVSHQIRDKQGQHASDRAELNGHHIIVRYLYSLTLLPAESKRGLRREQPFHSFPSTTASPNSNIPRPRMHRPTASSSKFFKSRSMSSLHLPMDLYEKIIPWHEEITPDKTVIKRPIISSSNLRSLPNLPYSPYPNMPSPHSPDSTDSDSHKEVPSSSPPVAPCDPPVAMPRMHRSNRKAPAIPTTQASPATLSPSASPSTPVPPPDNSLQSDTGSVTSSEGEITNESPQFQFPSKEPATPSPQTNTDSSSKRKEKGKGGVAATVLKNILTGSRQPTPKSQPSKTPAPSVRKKQVEELKAVSNTLREQKEMAYEELKQERKKIESLVEEQTKLQQEIVRLSSLVEQVTMSKEELARDLGERAEREQEEQDRAKEELEQEIKKFEEMSNAKDSLVTELQQTHQQLEEVQKEKDSVVRHVMQLELQASDKEVEQHKLQLQLRKKNQDMDDARKEIEELQAEKYHLQQQVEKIRQQRDELLAREPESIAITTRGRKYYIMRPNLQDGVMDLRVATADNPTILEGPLIYPCQHSKPRGIVHILNNKCFQNRPDISRHGSEFDVINLENVFMQMGYEVHTPSDRTRYQTLAYFKEASNYQQLQHVSSFFVFILSHGEGAKTFFAQDMQAVTLDEVRDNFLDGRCPLLKGKPKFFFSHFCRGTDEEITAPLEPEAKREAPNDTLCLYSTTEGFRAYRNGSKGTPCVRAFCKTLATYAKDKSLDEIIRLFQQEYRKLEGSTTPEVQNFNFNKRFYFNPV